MALPATYDFAGDGALSASWSILFSSNSMVRVSGRAKTDGVNTDYGNFWNADSFNADQYSKHKYISGLASATHYGSTLVRASANNCYIYEYDGANDNRLYEVVSGGWTGLGSAETESFSSGDEIKLVVAGTGGTFSLKAYKNGTEIASYTTSNSAHTSGAAGICAYEVTTSDMQLDDWEGGNGTGAAGLLPVLGKRENTLLRM